MARAKPKAGPLEGRVRQIMLRDFVSAAPGMTAYEAERLMRAARIRHLVVVQEDALLGVLSYRDLLEFALGHLERDPRGLVEFRSATIESLMSRNPVTATEQTTLREAALRMVRHRIGCLPIVKGAGPEPARLVGLLTESDLIRAALRPPQP